MVNESYDQVCKDYSSFIWRVAKSYERDPYICDDLYQECLLALWQALKSFRGEASLKTFVARVAHNRCISHVIKASKQPPHRDLEDTLISPDDNPEDQLHKTFQRRRIFAALLSLPIDWRPIISLTLEGYTPAEIAEVLGIGPNIVSIRLTRAKQKLKALLGDSHD